MYILMRRHRGSGAAAREKGAHRQEESVKVSHFRSLKQIPSKKPSSVIRSPRSYDLRFAILQVQIILPPPQHGTPPLCS